jgi:FAD/FMN-containing dehydrogenase
VGFEGTGEICERYGRDLARLARTAAAQNAVIIHDTQFSAMLEILREAPATMRSAAKQSVVFRFAALPAQLPNLLRALRSFANSSWMPPATLIRSACIVYLAMLAREDDESAPKQLAYFCNSVGSLRGKLEFSPSLLFCPAEWKSALSIPAQNSADLDLHRRVKRAFDPNSAFAPGRFVGGI